MPRSRRPHQNTRQREQAIKVQTDYIEPDAAVVTELVAQLLLDASHKQDPDVWQWVRSGSSSLVVLAGEVAVRIGRDSESAAQLQGTQKLVDQLPKLTFEVPRSVTPARTHLGVTGVAVERIHGQPHPPEPVDPHILRDLLDEIHSIPIDDVRPNLAPARAFYGGELWRQVLIERVVPLLPGHVRAEAENRIEALAALETPHRVLNHSDLAGANMHWRSGKVVGVLDWDLASEDDPAEDVATLVSWHGWHLAAQVADAGTVRRAEVFRNAFPLMVAGFTVLRDRPKSEISRVLDRVTAKLSERSSPLSP